MKKYLIIALSLVQINLYSQDLIDIYKSGTVKLIPDTDYARDVDWNNVFRSYYDSIRNTPIGARKSLVLLPDGSVIVNHAYKNYHTRFSPSGNFEKEFTIEKAKHKPVMGVINGNTLFTGLDNMGIMTCSDLDGNFKKTLTLDYAAKSIIPLNNGNFAVVGWVIWSKSIRLFVSIVDYQTNKEKVIWEHFSERPDYNNGMLVYKNKQPFNYSMTLNNGNLISYTSMPFSRSTGKGIPPQITSIHNDLIVAVPNTGEILVFDLDGNPKSKQAIDWPEGFISVDEQKKIQQKAIDNFKEYLGSDDEVVQDNLEHYKKMISEMEEDLKNIKTPLVKPSFSTTIKDSDDNILFFEIPKEKDANVFHVWVYNDYGKFESKCTFVCDEYDLDISNSKMVFHNGFIYGIQALKNVKGIPLRLVRFKLSVN